MNEPSRDLLDAAAPPPDGTVVLMLATATSRHWAADTAIELCTRWAADGRRIVLADLHLEDPFLHTGVALENLEGVSDIFLYGASLSRIARPVKGGAFYLIPAGTYAPDVDEIYRHPRWKKLLAGFRDTNAVLVLFAPENVDLDAFARFHPEAIAIGPAPGEQQSDELSRLGIPLAAVLEPPSPTAAPSFDTAPISSAKPAAATPAIPDRSLGAGELEPAALEGPLEPVGVPQMPGTESIGAEAAQPVATPPPAPERPTVQLHRPPEHELELPPPPIRKRPERRTASVLLVILFLIILLGTVGYLVATIRPDLIQRFLVTDSPTLTQVEPEALVPVEPQRMAELLPYSVQVKAFPSLDAAREEMAVEQERLETVPFFISPEEIQGITYFKILSGMTTDTTAAIRLRDHLVEIGAVDEEDTVGAWSLIQFTPLAFDLGEYPTRAAAAERADSLLTLSIPSYTAAVDYSDGSERWHLYAGAFPDSATAVGMRRMLTEAGVEAPLSARTGRPAILPE